MIKSIPIPPKQIKLLAAAQHAANKANNDLGLVAGIILAGLDIEGQLVSVDTDKNLLNIEVPEPVA